MPELIVKLDHELVPYCPSCEVPTRMEPYTQSCFKCPACRCIDDIG